MIKAPYEEGASVLIYRKLDGRADEESIREGEIVAVKADHVSIRFESYEKHGGTHPMHIAMFGIVPGHVSHKRRLGEWSADAGIFFAEIDEDFLP